MRRNNAINNMKLQSNKKNKNKKTTTTIIIVIIKKLKNMMIGLLTFFCLANFIIYASSMKTTTISKLTSRNFAYNPTALYDQQLKYNNSFNSFDWIEQNDDDDDDEDKKTKNHRGSLIKPRGGSNLALTSNDNIDKQHNDYYYNNYYYYTRTREHPYHLRVSEELKNKYVGDVRYESRVNGTKFEYYKSSALTTMSYDELIFETIDKIFRHRLSAFYVHHYDNEDDKRRSSNPARVSHDKCARDLLYLVEKLPKKSLFRDPFASLLTEHTVDGAGHAQDYADDERLTPELTAFFDSYARQEAGLLMGNTFWVGAYDQCVNRHVFEIIDSDTPGQRQQKQPRAKPKGPHERASENQNENANNNQEEQQQVISFKGQYCVASLKAPGWDEMIERKKQIAHDYFKSERQKREYSRLFRLQVGICLPDSCDSTAFERHKEELRLLAKSTLESRFADYELNDLFCLPDETSPLRQLSYSAIGFLLFLASWLAAILVATLFDVLQLSRADNQKTSAPTTTMGKIKAHSESQFVCWFSLRANYTKFMHVTPGRVTQNNEEKTFNEKTLDQVEQSQEKIATNLKDQATNQVVSNANANLNSTATGAAVAQVDLRFLNAFKALIMFWIINGHIMLLMIQTAKNILNSDALLNGLMHFLIGATFGVDLFFTMTGFLTAYLMFNSGTAYKMKLTTWIYLTFHRYWRLAPMYLLTFWFSKSVMQHLGSGPLWDYGTTSITFRGLCNHQAWSYPLTLTSNLHGLFEECMITSWYISCDMQFWLVSPVFIYLLAKSPFHGWIITIITIVASSKLRYDAILSDKSARYDELVQPRADIFMRVSHDLPALYTHPHYRISAYLVGLLAGHFVYKVSASLNKKNNLLRENNNSGNNNSSGQISNVKRETKLDEWLDARLRNFLATLGLTMTLAMAFVSYVLANYFPNNYLAYAKLLAAICYSVDHLVMSVGFSLLIVTLCLGQWPSLVSFFSHPNWSRLSKINYALLLLQCEAIYYQIFRYDQVPVAGTKELTNILFNLLVTLYPLAFLVTLVFEFPLVNIEKLLLGGGVGGSGGQAVKQEQRLKQKIIEQMKQTSKHKTSS